MIGVLLGAGDGKRIAGYHEYASKVLIQIDGESLIKINMDRIDELVDSFVVVVGKAKKEIKEDIGYVFKGKAVTYVEQKVRDGPLGALKCAYPLIKDDDVIVVLADEYIIGDRLNQVYEVFNRRYPDAILGVISESDENYIAQTYSVEYKKVDSFRTDVVKRLVEKPTEFPNRVRGTGYYFISEGALQVMSEVPARENGQYEITDFFNALITMGGMVITREIAEKAYNINSVEILDELIG